MGSLRSPITLLISYIIKMHYDKSCDVYNMLTFSGDFLRMSASTVAQPSSASSTNILSAGMDPNCRPMLGGCSTSTKKNINCE